MNEIALSILLLGCLCVALAVLLALAKTAAILGSWRLYRTSLHNPMVTGLSRLGTRNQYMPVVSIHIPISTEVPEAFRTTLEGVMQLDYPYYNVIVVINNNPIELEPQLTAELNEWVNQGKIVLYDIGDAQGFKAGALNYALDKTPEETEIIAIIDAGTQVYPSFLREAITGFKEPSVQMVQTHKSRHYSTLTSHFQKGILPTYRYFSSVYQPWLAAEGCALFDGNMGLIRKSVLIQLGGWDLSCVTEDTELSIRVLSVGGKSVYLDHVYGSSMPPSDFTAYRQQRYRWTFGNMQVLRRHCGLFTRRGNAMPLQMTWRLLASTSVWLNFSLIPYTILSLIAATAVALNKPLPFTDMLFYLGTIIVGCMFLPEASAYYFIVRKKAKTSWLVTTYGLVSHLSISFALASASMAGLVKSQGRFVSTSKGVQRRKQPSLATPLPETAIGLCLVMLSLVVLVQSPTGINTYAASFTLFSLAGFYLSTTLVFILSTFVPTG